jgi:hypothetical protein
MSVISCAWADGRPSVGTDGGDSHGCGSRHRDESFRREPFPRSKGGRHHRSDGVEPGSAGPRLVTTYPLQDR